MIPRLVADHNPAVEGVELEEPILPSFLLPSDIVCEETPELCDGRGLGGGKLRSVRDTSHRRRHCAEICVGRVGGVLYGIGAAAWRGGGVREG